MMDQVLVSLLFVCQLLFSVPVYQVLDNYFYNSACTGAKWIHNEDGESGRLEFWFENGYDAKINCFFRIEVPEVTGRMNSRRKVKVQFEAFDFGTGYDYDISLTSNDPESIVEGGRFPRRGSLFIT